MEDVPSTVVCPMLSSTNYTVWVMRMNVLLRVHKVWESIEPGTCDEENKDITTAFLFQSIPENRILQVGEVDSPKEIWEAVKSRNLGAERIKEAHLQTLMNEFGRLRMKDTNSKDIFSGKISKLASKSAALGQAMEEPKLVKKFLNSLPRSKYIQIIASLEQVLDLNKTSFEDIVGRLKAYEERIQEEDTQEPQGNLLYTDSNQSYNSRGRGRGWNRGRGNRGRGRNTQEISKGKKDYSQITCYSYKKKGHFAFDCPEEEQDDHELNKADTEEADVALYMHEIVFLNEEKVIPKTLVQSKREGGMWYLDNGANNHITGERSYFCELNESIKGKVKFGDGSCVDINGKGSILFEAKTWEHRLLTDIYYIPDLKSNILSLGQATEQGCDVRMRDNYLTLKDPNGRLLAKVLRSPNRMY
ncbi:PREDICTED: uncharacterized protein LOC106344698 [Brassica oleracea var. oleracea]|uniref:uncharacterized protein LOC106344698 n=1 Tax=Brassica oleracea var. oleracea TaxID=109376 RepID=UPI0006A6EA03|nr:PREDICTED: uncharacterized protein LOC106344698 [Brassica oleracea var. oleracea]